MHGRRVLVTRAAEQAAPLAALLEQKGATPVLCPLIETVEPTDNSPLAEAFQNLASYDWLLLTSANTVRFGAGLAPDLPPDLHVAAVGPGTQAAARQVGWNVTLTAKDHVGEGLLEALLSRNGNNVRGLRFLLPRAAEARDVLPDGLSAAGAHVDVVTAYVTRMPAAAAAQLLAILKEHRLDAVLFTSPSTVHNCVRALGRASLGDAVLGYIGPIAAGAARELGLRVDFVADPHSIPDLVAALESWFTG